MVQYLRASPRATATPKPYFIQLDRSHYQTLEVKNFTALLDIDADGCVTRATFEPQLPSAIDYQLTQEATSLAVSSPPSTRGGPGRRTCSCPSSFRGSELPGSNHSRNSGRPARLHDRWNDPARVETVPASNEDPLSGSGRLEHRLDDGQITPAHFAGG